MKIKINEYETYELNLPDEMNAGEFLTFQSRVNYIVKLIGRDSLLTLAKDGSSNLQSPPRTRILNKHKKWFTDREFGLNVMKRYYLGNVDEKKTLIIELGCSYHSLKNDMTLLKTHWNIEPKEIGIVEFPKAGKKIELLTQNETNTKEDDKEEAIEPEAPAV